MARLLLFHHALGLTDGVKTFADSLRKVGHTVDCPDLYDGATFSEIDEGVAHAESIGMGEIIRRGEAAADGMPPGLVYGGFSLGVLPAQKLAMTRPGAKGALLYHEGLDPAVFDGEWQEGVALQVHVTEADPWADHEAIRGLESDAGAELFVYPGDAHLFADASYSEFDADAAALLVKRTRDFLARNG